MKTIFHEQYNGRYFDKNEEHQIFINYIPRRKLYEVTIWSIGIFPITKNIIYKTLHEIKKYIKELKINNKENYFLYKHLMEVK